MPTLKMGWHSRKSFFASSHDSYASFVDRSQESDRAAPYRRRPNRLRSLHGAFEVDRDINLDAVLRAQATDDDSP